MLAAQTIIGQRYRIVRAIGSGGMALVYEARDTLKRRTVALKQLTVPGEQFARAFKQEARLLARLSHPGLPQVHDHFSDEQGQFLVMDFIPGPDLRAKLTERATPFALPEVLLLADQVLDVLEYLHRQEIIHRDIKPANLKEVNKQVRLLDFGLTKGNAEYLSYVSQHAIAGYTLKFAPPEQIRGQRTNARSDLFSLGATLYCLLAGVDPPDVPTRWDALGQRDPDPLRPITTINPEVPSGVSDVLRQAMQMRPLSRPDHATAMRQALRDAVPELWQPAGNGNVAIGNAASNQGAQGIFYGPMYFGTPAPDAQEAARQQQQEEQQRQQRVQEEAARQQRKAEEQQRQQRKAEERETTHKQANEEAIYGSTHMQGQNVGQNVGTNTGRMEQNTYTYTHTHLHNSSQQHEAEEQQRQQHNPKSAERRLDAAMPRRATVNMLTEVWAQICLPGSQGFKRELPQETEFGDEIEKQDVRRDRLSVLFPKDQATGQPSATNVRLHLRISECDFQVDEPVKDVHVSPYHDSGKIIFALTPLRASRKSRVQVEAMHINADGTAGATIGTVALVTMIEREAVLVLAPIPWVLSSTWLLTFSTPTPTMIGGKAGAHLYNNYQVESTQAMNHSPMTPTSHSQKGSQSLPYLARPWALIIGATLGLLALLALLGWWLGMIG